MPFAGYQDFAACVASNRDKRDPEAYCGHIQHQVEGEKALATCKYCVDPVYKAELQKPLTFNKFLTIRAVKVFQVKDALGQPFWHIAGWASDGSVDRDGDRMALSALKDMDGAIGKGMNLYLDHNHDVPNMIGVITKHQVVGDGLWIEARLQAPEKNAKVADILNKMETGMKLGFSIGGDMGDYHMEDDFGFGKSVRVIDGVKLYEISLVGLPANENAFATDTSYKSFKKVPAFGSAATGTAQTYNEMTPQLPGASAPVAAPRAFSDENGGDEIAQVQALLQQVIALLSQSQAEQSAMAGKMGTPDASIQASQNRINMKKGTTMGTNPLNDPNVRMRLIEALKAWGEGDFKESTEAQSAWKEPGAQPMGGELPPAVTQPKPKDLPNQPEYPPSGDKTMSNEVKKGAEMGGTKMPMPDPGTVAGKSEEKPSAAPGTGTGFGAGSEVGTGKDVMSGMGTGSTDKPSFSATDIPGGKEALPSGVKHEEENEEEAVKRFRSAFRQKKAEEAKKKMDDGAKLFEEVSGRAKAEEELEAYLKEEEARLTGLRGKFDEIRGIHREALPAPASTGPTGAPKPAPMPGPAPAPAAVGGAPTGVAPTGASAMSEEMAGMAAMKALSGLFGAIVTKYAGSNPAATVEMRKEFDEAIKQVFQPSGGSDNFVNLRSPGQPPAKIAAEPGQSGSSGVYRTETGKTPGLDTMTDSKLNPPATLDTAANEPIGTYQKPTELMSGTGYQMEVLRSVYAESQKRMHPSYKAFLGVKSEEDKQADTETKVLPLLKHFASGQAPSKEQLAELVKDAKIEPALIKSVDAPSSTVGETEDSVILKGLKRIRWTE